jgi:alkanesulfonate monooxygenase SsuD/methylene tetrahydromethanopterin reductase-like flavin-dependent oxidoreductase (luciferase family)
MYARPKLLNIAAQYADGINLAWSYTEDIFADRMQQLDELCEKYDRKPDSLRRSYGVWTRIFESNEEKKKVFKEIAEKRNFSLEEVEKRFQGSMHGTVEELIEWLKAYKKLGVEQFIFMFPEGKEMEQMKIMAEEIIPKI